MGYADKKSGFAGKKVLIATPAYVYIEYETERSIHMLYEYSKYNKGTVVNDIDRIWIYGSTVPWFRNAAVKDLLRGHWDYLLFVDRDMIFERDSLKRLIETNKDIVGGIYVFRQMTPEAKHKEVVCALRPAPDGILRPMMVQQVKNESLVNGVYNPIKVDVIGMGLTLIKRKVFETIPFPWYAQPPDHNPQSMGATGEDRHFCTKAKEYGFDIWLHPGIKLTHIGKSYSIPDL